MKKPKGYIPSTEQKVEEVFFRSVPLCVWLIGVFIRLHKDSPDVIQAGSGVLGLHLGCSGFFYSYCLRRGGLKVDI